MTMATSQQADSDSINSYYYLARDSNVSANSMPQFPCTAKSHTSLRNQRHDYHQNRHQNIMLPRSPRIPSSLSDITQNQQQNGNNNNNNSIRTTSYHQQPIHSSDQCSITEIPLNTGDNNKFITNGKQERRQVLHGASSSQTLVAIPTASPQHERQHHRYLLRPLSDSSSSNNNNRQRESYRSSNSQRSWRVTAANSILSILSAPSKINRSTTQHYIFTPPSLAELKQNHQSLNNIYKDEKETVIMYMDEYDEKGSKSRVHIKKPSQRGICNTMTIATVILVILFLFAGYPLALHIAKQMSEDNHPSSSSPSSSD